MTQTTTSTFTDSTGTTWPNWVKRAQYAPPPEVRVSTGSASCQRISNTAAKRKGEPGFKVTQQQLDTDSYLWFRAVRGEDCSRCPALVRPHTYFHAPGSDYYLRVPNTVLNMAYREAAMLARRTTRCSITNWPIAHRITDVHNDRVWYLVDEMYEDVWVGVRLSTLTSLDKSGSVRFVTKRQVPNVRWSNSTRLTPTNPPSDTP